MEKTNQKIVTLSFVIAAFLVGISLSYLLRAFAGAFGVVAQAMDKDLVRHGVPVAVGLFLFFYLQFNQRIVLWADEVVSEIKKIVWPSRKDTTAMTIAVVVMVLISAVIISFFDFLSGYIINNIFLK